MTNHKNTKRALFTSVISMLLCVTMLIGSTFAWFTDNASTAVNTIESGTLDIRLQDGEGPDANSLEGGMLNFAKAENAPEGEKVLFEPGAKYALDQVWLYNAGSLHAKYQVRLIGIDGSALLAQVLDVYVAGESVGTLADLVANDDVINDSVIAPGASYTFGEIELKMQESAGNEYQGLTISGIAIGVQATQAAVEYDSDDNQYDAGAEYAQLVIAKDQTDLNAAIDNATGPIEVELEKGTYDFTKTPIVGKDVTFTGTKDTVFDMSAQKGVDGVPDMTNTSLTFDGVTIKWSDSNTGYQGIKNPEKVVYKNCTIIGTQFMYSSADFINCTFETADSYAVYTRGSGNYSFTDCKFITGGRAIMMYNDHPVNANVALNNCTFSDSGAYTGGNKAVVETGDNPNAPKNTSKFNIVINNCNNVSGFEANNSTSELWGNKDSMPKERLNVVIDGVDVY